MRLRRSLVACLLAACCGFAVAGTASPLLSQADQYWSEGKTEQAQQAFEAAVAAEPGSPRVRLRLAGFQLANQQTSASIASYKQAISGEAGNSTAWIGLGLAYLHSSQPELARAAFEEAVRIDPARKERIDPLIAKLKER
jgi:Tfp pilus assembly protein PilF